MITRCAFVVLTALVLVESNVINNLDSIKAETVLHRSKRQSDSSCEQADIIMVLDSSGSIGEENWLKVLNFTKTMILAFPVGHNDVRFGVAVYGNRASVAFDLNSYNDSESYLTAVDNIGWKDQATNTSGGIRLMYSDMFTEEKGDRAGVPNLGIIITDGASNRDEDKTIPEADNAREEGILMFALGIGEETVQAELNGIGNDPDEDFVFEVESFDSLDNIKEQLVSAACEAAAACSYDSDLVLIFDSSGSIGASNFNSMKAFVANFIEDLNVTPDNTHVGVVTFSDSAEVEFQLSEGVESRVHVMDLINEIEFRSGTTNTADALRTAREEVYGEDGDRDNIQDVIVLFTDGGSDDFEETINEAIQTRLDGITILVVAIGSWVDYREVYEIATDPDNANVFEVEDVNDIPNIRQGFKAAVCNDRDDCSSRPCRNGGTCVDTINAYMCLCPDNFAGVNCNIPCSNPKDLSIALDSSDSISDDDFYAMQDFVKSLTVGLPLDDHSRMAVEIYASDAVVKIDLDDYDTKWDYLQAISFVRERGETDTAEALITMRDDMFSNSGDRGSAANVGLLISDGGSSDREATWEQAMATRADDITLLAVGVGVENKRYNQRELRGIVSDPEENTLFFSDDYVSLGALNDAIVTAVCNDEDNCDDSPCNNGECVDLVGDFYCECDDDANGRFCERECDREMDLVIMLDNSGSIRSKRFEDIFKVFVKDIVKEMDVRPDATRVGLLTFNDVASVQFNLDTYSTREDVLQAVDMLKYERGKTNMADAFQMAREDMFTSGNGARDDVRNVIIMITDGRATVDPERTLPEAIETRLAGIHIIVAAAEQASTSLELKGIATDPDDANLFTVNRFSGMPDILGSVVAATCNSENECDSNPCQSGGDCIDELGYYYCECSSSRTGRNCERECTARMDLVFVLDLSGSVELMVDIELELTKEIVQGLNFGGGRVRVGIVTFSDDAESMFYLNEYNDKLSVLNAIAYMQKKRGTTNTADALELTASDMFTSRNGDRSGDDDVIIVLSDGNSNVNQGDTVPRANDLKNDGVRLLAVGIGERVNNAEINDMASDPDNDNAFFVEAMDDIVDVASDILDQLCDN